MKAMWRTDSIIIRKPPRNEGLVEFVWLQLKKKKINKDVDILEASEWDDQKFKKLGEVPGEN